MNHSKLNALINLLDDTDQRVYELVEQELTNEKKDIIPHLEQKWENSDNQNLQLRIEDIIQTIQLKENKTAIKDWINSDEQDLLTGYLLIDQFQYPELNTLKILSKIEALRKEIWVELKESLTYLEKVTVLNHYLYNIKGFSVDYDNYFSLQNHFLNQLLDKRCGNSLSLALFYAILAHRLELPVKIIDYPRNPLIAIVHKNYARKVHGKNSNTDVLFYINPANKGSLTSKKELEYHLRRREFTPLYKFTEPQSNALFIKRLLESLHFSYQEAKNNEKSEQVKNLLSLFRE